MEMTEHATKRMYLLLGTDHERKEVEFRSEFLLAGTPPIHWVCGLNRNEISLFAERCEIYNIKILGYEVSLESEHPLYILTYEDYSKEYVHSWWMFAEKYFESVGVENMIIPSILVPESVLHYYL